jgi:hypothetical protein
MPYRYELRGFARPQYFLPSGTATAVSQICKLTDTSDTLLQSLLQYNGQSYSYYNDASFILAGALAGTTVRVNCSVDNSAALAPAANLALYVDNVSLALVKDTTLNR